MSRQNIGRAPRWLAASALAGILLGTAALAPETADAQTTTLISNTGQADEGGYTAGTGGTFPRGLSQAFTTGSVTGGYTITEIVLNQIQIQSGNDALVVNIQGDSSDAPDGTAVATLIKPNLDDTSTIGNARFTVPGAGLAVGINETYHIVLDCAACVILAFSWTATDSASSDANPATGWSIPAAGQRLVGSNWGALPVAAQRFEFQVIGHAGAPRIPPNAMGDVTIDGVAEVGVELTANTDLITDVDGLDTPNWQYQWERANDSLGGGAADIGGATMQTYTPIHADDHGKYLRVKVMFTDNDGTEETKTSDWTAGVVQMSVYVDLSDGGVTYLGDATTSPVITGNFRVGEVLTVDSTGVRDPTGTPTAADNIRIQVNRIGSTTRPASFRMIDAGTNLLNLDDDFSTNTRTVPLPPSTAGQYLFACFQFTRSGELRDFVCSRVYGPVLPALPVVTVAASASSVLGGASAEFTLTRTGGDLATALAVGISVTGSGILGTSATPTTATFQANLATATVQVETNTLTAGDANQSVVLTIPSGSGTEYTVGSSPGNMATVTVTAPLPVVTVMAKNAQVIGGTDPAVFVLTRTGDTAAALVLDITMGGENPAYSNFGNRPNMATIPAGSQSYDLEVETSAQSDGDSWAMTLTVNAVSGRYTVGDPAMATVDVNEFINLGPAMGMPKVQGTLEVGQTLMAVPGVITDLDGLMEAIYGYSWMRADDASGMNEEPIPHDGSSSYTLQDGELNRHIRVEVFFMDDNGNQETVSSEWTATAVMAAPLPEVTLPEVTVEAVAASVVGGADAVFTLTRTGDTASELMVEISVAGNGASGTRPATATFSENSATATVSVATNTLAAGDPSQSVTLTIIQPISGNAYTAGPPPDNMATVAVEPMPIDGAPEITGTAKVGETLTSTEGTISDSDNLRTPPGYTYQWQRQDGSSGWGDISGAMAANYALVTADRFRKVRVIYRFTDAAGDAEERTSSPYPAGAATVEPVDNVAATGEPTISGTAAVGNTLTASATGIMDANGLIGAVYRYQWERADAGQTNWTRISEATSNTYNVVAGDEGGILRVVASFSDDDRYPESRASAPTVMVLPALAFTVMATTATAVEPAPGASATPAANELVFTVALNRAPEQTVTVTYSFSGSAEEGRDYETQASKTLYFAPGAALMQEVRVAAIGDIVAESDGDGSGESVIITVGEATATGKINEPPDQIAVGTSEPSVRNEDGTTIVSFSFSPLSAPAPAGGLEVEWRVSVGGSAGSALGRSAGARARVPCTVSPCGGTVTYPAGDTMLADPDIEAVIDMEGVAGMEVQVQVRPTAATANFAVMPDANIAANEQTVASAAGSEWVVAGVTTVSAAVLETSAALVHAVAGVGRSAAAGIVESIWRRAEARRAGGLESRATLGGRTLDTQALSSGDAGRAAREVASLLGLQASAPDGSLDALDAGYSHGGGIDDYRTWAGIPDAGRLADQTSFALLAGDWMGAGPVAIWGEFSATGSESKPDENSLVDSDTLDVLLGFDVPVSSETLYGLAFSDSSGESKYTDASTEGAARGTVETSLRTIAPYVHWTGPSGGELWGSFGIGSGTLTRSATAGGFETDLSVQMLAGGAHANLRNYSRSALSFKFDALLARTVADETLSSAGRFAELSTDSIRARAALVWTGSGERKDALAVSHRIELGARFDGGEADEGAGLDFAGAFRFASLDKGYEVNAHVSSLLLHSQNGFKELGFGLSMVFDPGIRRRGASLSLEPTWNVPRSGVAESMWGGRDIGGNDSSDAGAAMKARLGYGAETLRERALATLYGEAETGEEDRRLRLGTELRGLAGPLERLSIDIYGEREESQSSSPNDSVMLEGSLGF